MKNSTKSIRATKYKRAKPVTLELHLNQWLKQKHHTVNPYGEKLDRNGYSRPLLQGDESIDYCYLCGVGGDLARHEIFNGSSRQTSKAVGCWVTLCPRCHDLVHRNAGLTVELKQFAQRAFEYKHSHEDFMLLFGENYL